MTEERAINWFELTSSIVAAMSGKEIQLFFYNRHKLKRLRRSS